MLLRSTYISINNVLIITVSSGTVATPTPSETVASPTPSWNTAPTTH